MSITIDRMAQRYGLLPTEVLDRATTFDLYCMDVTLRYEHRQHQIANGKQPDVPELSQDDMLKMLKQTRGE